ncbi:MAG: multicopper oxidase domain-containing protein [Moorea sp. SIO4E2]|uniref:multicopper oxidase family protein n=1 Tax=Moorena sp. SIO4E2 TaxID=2607826 RepID=UPI0013B9D672|nr:multicopper oxidase domain-containing protein [Moorena sp. SIO4E2]NEQ07195.1 multicopper oxidase domain-containing protein [Moorena sp. SIO4E2]
MTQEKPSPEQHSSEQELDAQKFHFGRRHFLAIGAGAATGLAFSAPAFAKGARGCQGKQLQTTTLPTFQQPPVAPLGTAENPTELAIDYISEAVSFSSETRQEVTMRYYSYGEQGPFERTSNHLLRPGPTFKFKARNPNKNTLNLKLKNNLPPNEGTNYPSAPPHPSTGSPGVADRPKDFNTTNLHFHGFHVSPLSRTLAGQPGSALDSPVSLSSDDIFAAVHPKGEMGSTGEHLYQVVVPKFHAPGTHWYHPHQHGSTALQLADGMVGALIIEEQGDAVIDVDRDLVMIAQEVITEDAIVKPDPDLPPVPGDQMIYNCSPASYKFTINGYLNPILKMQPGELHRWRFINATATTRGFIQLELRKVEDDGKTQTLQDLNVIALDGISFYGRAPEVKQVLVLNPANRADLLIQLNEPGTYQLWKKVWRAGRGNLGEFGIIVSTLMREGPQQQQILATITVEGDRVTSPKNIPDTIPGDFPEYLQPITDDQLLHYEVRYKEENGNDAIQSLIYERPFVFGFYKETRTQNCNFYMQRPKDEEDKDGKQFNKDIKSGKLNPGQANPNPRLLQINGVSFTPKSGSNYISYLPAYKVIGAYELDEKKPYNPGRFTAGAYRNETVQLVKLNTCEEWIIFNYSNVAHPFHIHMAPFQVVEVYDPNYDENNPVKYDPATSPWHDTYPIPPFKYIPDLNKLDYPDNNFKGVEGFIYGYLKIRLRFTDFWGKYVFHCHLLNHEDQGMMQTIYVMNDDGGTGYNPFTQVKTSTGVVPKVTIGDLGALPANYYPPTHFEPYNHPNIPAESYPNAYFEPLRWYGKQEGFPVYSQLGKESFPPQVEITSDGKIVGIVNPDPIIRF